VYHFVPNLVPCVVYHSDIAKAITTINEVLKMKEVYVLFGRKDFHESVFDHDGNYFGESPVLELFENFDDAFIKFKKYVVEAYNNLKKYGDLVIDTHFLKETTEADLFDNYNCDTDSEIERDICWIYNDYFKDSGSVSWESSAFNVRLRDDTPILPSLYIKKVQIQ